MSVYETTNRNEIPAHYEYDRTDRNGTEYYIYIDTRCPKCGGSGVIPYYNYVDGGICYECGGSGYKMSRSIIKLFTAEYYAKLTAKRNEKQNKKNAEWLKRFGLESESVYFVLGNTFEIKDQIKEHGGIFCGGAKAWYFPKVVEGFKLFAVDSKRIYHDDWYTFRFDDDELFHIRREIQEANNRINAEESPSRHIGIVGERIESEVKLSHIGIYETNYTYIGEINYIYTFEDKDKNIIVWKTAKDLDISEGAEVRIRGTIKEHNDYRGIKQTILTRCKVA